VSGRKWEPVTRSSPCPVCGKPDWCVHVDGGTICPRTESRLRAGEAGWFHPDGEQRVRLPFRSWRIPPEGDDHGDLADRYFNAFNAGSARAALAARLEVGVGALERLRVGWNAALEAWTFPLRDARGRIVGIQNRFNSTDEKRVVRGHRAGVFEPAQLDVRGSALLVCEGASDTAAALTLGLEAIGRFSCEGTLSEVVSRVRLHRPRLVVIVRDNDEAGRRGADALLRALDGIVQASIRTPPARIKDLRAWKQAGATAGEIMEGAGNR
jgi:hypothetical protein